MDDSLARFNEALAGRYRLSREVGAGGMAIVYLAHDPRHDRAVAIKALRPEFAAAVARDRFLAEIAATARLQHPNILPLFDSGEAGEVLYYVMPFVQGASLRERLTRDRQLALADAVAITSGVAAALHHAHNHGVVHRDIKPDNILLCDGVPVVSDFGIARALASADARLTDTGLLIGSPAYMSPEQSSGDPVDARSDVYSLACVLYEALAGTPPHSAPTLQALIARRLTSEPAPVRERRADTPAHVDNALSRALAIDPAQRFASAADFAAALRHPDDAATQALVLRAEPLSYALLMQEDDTLALVAHERARHVVRATIEASGGTLRESPGHALMAVFHSPQDCLACARAARDAVARLNDELPAAQRVHFRFGIAHGEVRDDGRRVAGSAVEVAGDLATTSRVDSIRVGEPLRERLSDADSAAPEPLPQLEALDLPPPARPSIAIMPFDAPNGDPDAQAVAEGLRIDITNALMKIQNIFITAPSTMNHFRGLPGEETARKVGTRHVLEGNVRRSGDRVRVAMQLVDIEHGGLAWSERYDRVLDDAFELQDEIAARVISELDVRLSLGEQARVWKQCLAHPVAREHYYRGLAQFFQSTRDSVAAARREFERVAALVPASPVGATWTALSLWLQATRGWADDALSLSVAWARRAASLPDADGQAHTVLGATLLLQHRWDDALHVARDSVRIRPGCNTANGVLANVLLHCGEYEGAIFHARRAIRIGPVYPPWFLEILGSAERELGRFDAAVVLGREVLRLAPDSVSGRVVLTSALVRAGWLVEAAHVAGSIPRLEPDFSVHTYLAKQPFRHEEVRRRLAADLLSAGLTP